MSFLKLCELPGLCSVYWVCKPEVAQTAGLEETTFPPPRFIVRVMCSVLGLFVRQSDPQFRDVNVRVYIANHVTQFDHNVINLLTSCNTVSNLELSMAGLEAPLSNRSAQKPLSEFRCCHGCLQFLFINPGLHKP